MLSNYVIEDSVCLHTFYWVTQFFLKHGHIHNWVPQHLQIIRNVGLIRWGCNLLSFHFTLFALLFFEKGHCIMVFLYAVSDSKLNFMTLHISLFNHPPQDFSFNFFNIFELVREYMMVIYSSLRDSHLQTL